MKSARFLVLELIVGSDDQNIGSDVKSYVIRFLSIDPDPNLSF